jgi:uncharacterized protein (DUF2141 family)
MKYAKLFSLTAILAALAFSSASAATLKIVVEGAVPGKGTLRVTLFASEEGWLKTGVRALEIKADSAKATALIENLEDGEYAISVIDDLDDNGRLDSNAMGIPKEPYGFSNNAKGLFGPAKWADAKFKVEGDGVVRIRLD